MSAARQAIWGGNRDLLSVSLRLAETRTAIRRNAWALIGWLILCDLSGIAYAKMIKPEYVATAQILLKPRQFANDGPEDLRHFHQFAIDSELCETELRVIRSERLLTNVFDSLKLGDTAEMRGGGDGFWAGVARNLHRVAPGFLPFSEDLRAFYTFTDRLRSRRLGLAYVIDISYRGHTAEGAARVANAVASAYVAARLQDALARAQAAGPYLTKSHESLREQLDLAQAAVVAGTIPDQELPAADVRLLGAADVPLGPAYPKMVPILMWCTGFAIVSGLLILLFRTWPVAVRRYARERGRSFAKA